MKQVLIEIAASTLDAALAAQAGGADRVELFSNPLEGGTTPSEGFILKGRELLSTELHVLIRPRGGDFCYSDHEFEAMLRDIDAAKQSGVDGVAVGVLNLDGTVDLARLRLLVGASVPLQVTFHRAFDMCRDLPGALEELISCDVQRVLSSGACSTALQGIETLASLVRLAGERISVVAAGSIKSGNAQQIVRRSGVREVHAGLRTTIASPMKFHRSGIAFGPGANEYERVIVKESDVRSLVDALAQL